MNDELGGSRLSVAQGTNWL